MDDPTPQTPQQPYPVSLPSLPGDAVQTPPPQPPQTVPSQPAAMPGGGVGADKERGEELPPPETAPIVEIKEEEKIPEDVEGWLERLGHEQVIHLPEPIQQDDQVLLQNAHAQVTEDTIVLPVTAEELQQGLHQKVWSSARWLAEWCVRVVKVFGDKVRYKEAK